jgi:predicted amidohydrolase YtcJ
MIDALIVNANIHTLDDEQPRASAIAIHRDRIIAVGDDDLRSLATPRTRIHNLHGAMVLPGLTDAHIHWQWTSSGLREVDLFDVRSKAEALRRVGEAAARAKPGAWITGRGWAQAMWEGGVFPTASDLDSVAPNNPVFLKARSGHASWANTAAMNLAGIADSTPDPNGGAIQRDAHGRATGIFLEDATELISRVVPPLTATEIAALMEEMQKRAWRVGLTGIHDYDGPSAFEAMQMLHEHGRLGLRVVKNINDPYIHHAHGLKLRWGFGSDWLRLGGLKIFADGALGSLTALMIEPYQNDPNGTENRGITVTDKETMQELVTTASRSGFPSTIHAIGDRAVHDVLDVYESVRQEEARLGIPRDERRHRIEHVQIIHPDDAYRLGQLDIIASMQPIHATADYEMADRYWGERAKWSYNLRLQVEAGAVLALGSDSPVEPFDPLRGIHAAIARRRADGSPGEGGWYRENGLTINEAIRGYTQGAAFAAGMEDRLGKIASGYLADLVAFDRDLTTTPADDLLKAGCTATMVSGVWRYYGI